MTEEQAAQVEERRRIEATRDHAVDPDAGQTEVVKS